MLPTVDVECGGFIHQVASPTFVLCFFGLRTPRKRHYFRHHPSADLTSMSGAYLGPLAVTFQHPTPLVPRKTGPPYTWYAP